MASRIYLEPSPDVIEAYIARLEDRGDLDEVNFNARECEALAECIGWLWSQVNEQRARSAASKVAMDTYRAALVDIKNRGLY